MINIHPSLLPAFPGAHAHRDVIAAGATKSGCSVHYVDAGMDTGKVIAQYEVDVLPNDTESTLSSRIKRLEHKLYPMVIDAIASGDFSNLPWELKLLNSLLKPEISTLGKFTNNSFIELPSKFSSRR